MNRTLKRRPGWPVIIQLGMTRENRNRNREDNVHSDPNGYYRILELAPSTTITDAEIHSAYRRQVKKYHPDGSSPDVETFMRVQVAYEVLSNPELRAKYDSLRPTERWADDYLLAFIRQKLGENTRSLDLVDIASRIMASSEPTNRTVWETKRVFDSYAYYYDGDTCPSPDEVADKIESIKRWAWKLGYRGAELRVGFSVEDHSFVWHKPWGRILMVGALCSIPCSECSMRNNLAEVLDAE